MIYHKGAVTLYRKFFHPNSSLTTKEAWAFYMLVMMAAFKDTKKPFFINGRKIMIPIKRGQVIDRQRSIAKKIGISRSTLKRYLDKFQGLKLLGHQGERLRGSGKTFITIYDYDSYATAGVKKKRGVGHQRELTKGRKKVDKERSKNNNSFSGKKKYKKRTSKANEYKKHNLDVLKKMGVFDQ